MQQIGLFIVFDGIDGCGKSTQLELAASRLAAGGRRVVTTREPGGTPIAEMIRRAILSPQHAEMVSECELLLYAAARAQHVREKIAPAIAQGAIVLCDRFDLATYAYQGFGRSIPLTLLTTINEIATGGVSPDCTLFFDISVETAFSRLTAMEKAPDRLESGGLEFFRRVAEGYRTLAVQNPGKVIRLDAEKSIEELAEAVFEKIGELAG